MTLVMTLLLAVVTLGSGASYAEISASPEFEVRRSIGLAKSSGNVEQVLVLADGGFAVRDYSATDPEAQKIELYDRDGGPRGVIQRYGQGPGQYRRLSDLALDRDGSLWVADFGSTRVLGYSLEGESLRTLLVQNPSFRPRAVEVDREGSSLYLAGCYPTETYLDRGCLLVHRYDLESGDFRGSFVDTPAEVVDKRWAGRSQYDLALGSHGEVYLLHEAYTGLLRLDAANGDVTILPIETATAVEAPALSRETVMSTERKQAAMEGSFRKDRIEVSGPWMAVSIARPENAGYLVVLFHEEEQVTKDEPGPGRLVGSTGDGGFVFVRPEEGRFVLDLAYPTFEGPSGPDAESSGERGLR